MAFISIIGMTSGGNPYSLPGALGPSLYHGGGLRALFLFGHRIAGIAAYTKPRVWASPFFPRLVQHNFPAKSRFLVRPRLLTRSSSLPTEEASLYSSRSK